MKDWKTWYKLGAWSFVLLGSLHNIATVMMINQPITDESHLRVIEGMKKISPPIPTSHTLWDFHVGFSYILGWLLIAFGALAILSIKSAENNKIITLFNAGVSSLVCIYAVQYLFFVAWGFSGLAATMFLISYLKQN